jgi:glucose-1-phosphate adenylyltransferase
MRRGNRWFEGSADAIFQNFNLLNDEQPKYVIVFGADHIYRMDPQQMLHAHIDSGAGVTVAGIRVPVADADQFGVLQADDRGRITEFLEKPSNPEPLPDDPDHVFASMGNYIFSIDTLRRAVSEDAKDDASSHDLGGNIIPMLVDRDEAFVYDFASNDVPGSTERDRDYWRDVGTLDAFYEAHMDLVSVDPGTSLLAKS